MLHDQQGGDAMTKVQGLAVRSIPRGRLVALALGAALCLSALPAAAQHGRENGNRGNHNGWDRRHGEYRPDRRHDRRYQPAPNHSAPLFSFGLFGPAIVQRPHYAPPPPVYYAPPPRGYYTAPPPAYYGY
jgi:hypothetical protein